MLSDFLSQKIIAQLPFSPTDEQSQLIQNLSEFMTSHDKESVFLLNGYAGTGKTSVVSVLIKALTEFKQKAVLMAPTGRAAKVFSSYSGHSAFTIHKKIYRQKSATDFHFTLAENLHKHTLFIVDEASMIANSNNGESVFGSGRLLDDLISYVYTGEGCRLLLMGDDAQLPPVGQAESPALVKKNLESFSLKVSSFTLQQVVRQSSESGILYNATLLREFIRTGKTKQKPPFELNGFVDIERLSGADFIDILNSTYAKLGEEDCIVITRSNKQASRYNQGIRNMVLQKEDMISNGDLLMVVKNNYFWAKNYEQLDFIANGEIVKITRIRRYRNIYDLRFVEVSLRFLDYDYELDCLLLLDSLFAETPADMEALNKKLFENIVEDYADVGNKRERMKRMVENEYYNALQIKFAYAITCHKAQGGQWNTVFIDQGFIGENFTEDYYHWLYTAVTRATDNLYLVNFPEEYFE